VLSKVRDSMNLTTTSPRPSTRRMVTKRNVYSEVTSYVSAQMKELLDKAVIDSYLLQSPGIVVLDGRHVLYRVGGGEERLCRVMHALGGMNSLPHAHSSPPTTDHRCIPPPVGVAG
jgi:hypothetical protein